MVALWTGERWFELATDAKAAAGGGGFSVTAPTEYLGLIGVFRQPARGTLSPTPALSEMSLGVWGGGPVALLPTARSYWVAAEGGFVAYAVGVPRSSTRRSSRCSRMGSSLPGRALSCCGRPHKQARVR